MPRQARLDARPHRLSLATRLPTPETALSLCAGTRLPSPGIAGRSNASISGNGGQVSGNGGQVAGRHPVSCITSEFGNELPWRGVLGRKGRNHCPRKWVAINRIRFCYFFPSVPIPTPYFGGEGLHTEGTMATYTFSMTCLTL